MTSAERQRQRYWDAKGLPPPARPAREWLCAFCDARGPVSSEFEQREMTKLHLAGCATRIDQDARLDRALAALEADRDQIAGKPGDFSPEK